MVKTKKILALLLALAMVLSFAPMTISAEEADNTSTLEEVVTADKVVIVDEDIVVDDAAVVDEEAALTSVEEIAPVSDEFVGIQPAIANYATASQNNTMLAYYMDEPLYTAIVNAYSVGGAGVGVDPTLAQAKGWIGKIELSSQAITGTLRGIENFVNITTLNLATTALTGSIPEQIGNMTSLTTLYLQGNALSGSIPTSIENMTALQYVQLQNNQFTGEIPAGIEKLTAVKYFYLQTNQLTGGIPAGIGKMTELTALNLSANKLTGTIPDSIGALVKLTTLEISNNSLSGSIPTSIGNIGSAGTGLTNVAMSGNQLLGEIPSELGNLKFVSGATIVLNLSNNKLTGSIPDTFGNLTNLTQLLLQTNSLTGEIPSSMWNLTKLATLYLYSNKLTGEIPAEIKNLTALKYLQLQTNQLTGKIPAEIERLTSLIYLDLSTNGITGSIPSGIGSLKALTTLNLSANKLTGFIPSEISLLVALTSLNLGENCLTGSIPSGIGSLKALKTLALSGNFLTGAIPSEIESLTLLTSLNLGTNCLTGSIPKGIGSITSLTTLNLSTNYLTGSMPAEMSNLTKLTTIHLYNNNLTGGIPDSFIPNTSANTGMLALTYLDVGTTGLTSGLTVLSQIPTLQTIRLNACNLQEEMPESFTSLKKLSVFLANDNPSLTGVSPELDTQSLSGASSLLSFANTGMSGSLPSSYNSIPIYSLDITDSKITGAKPGKTTWFYADYYGLNKTADNFDVVYKYSDLATKYGSQNNGYMIYNQDLDGDGSKDINISFAISISGNRTESPLRNLDVNGDGKADLNITITGNSNYTSFNDATVLYKTDNSGVTLTSPYEIMGWYPSDMKVTTGAVINETTVKTSSVYPYYLENVDEENPVLVPRTKTILGSDGVTLIEVYPSTVIVPATLELNKTNEDGSVSNVDLDGDGIPDLNVTGGNILKKDQVAPESTDLETGLPNAVTTNTTPQNTIQSTDPTAPNYLPVGGTIPQDLYNIDLTGDGTPDYNVLPSGTTPSDFTNGKYTGSGTVENKTTFNDDGTMVPDNEINASRHVQMKLDLAAPASAQGRSLLPVVPSTVDTVEPGKEYTAKIYLQDIGPTTGLSIPLKFNSSVIKITGLDLGPAFDIDYNGEKLEPMARGTGMNPNAVINYQAGTAKTFDLINQNERLLLNFMTPSTLGYLGLKIDELANPNNMDDPANDANHFFTITFEVVGAEGKEVLFETYDRGAGDVIYDVYPNAFNPDTKKAFTYTYNAVDKNYDFKELTVSFDTISVARALQITVDAEDYYINQTDIALEAVVTPDFNPASDTVTWQFVDATDGTTVVGTYTADSADSRKVTFNPGAYSGDVKVIATVKGTVTANDTFEVVAGLNTKRDNDPSKLSDHILNLNTAANTTITAEMGGNVATIADGVLWKVFKMDTNGDYAEDTTVGIITNADTDTVTFAPTLPGQYKLVVYTVRHNEAFDEFEITVTANMTISGRVQLEGKTRKDLTGVWSWAGDNDAKVDAGIVVELIERSITGGKVAEKVISSATTIAVAGNAVPNYTLDVDASSITSFDDTVTNGSTTKQKYFIRFTRKGEVAEKNNKNESYLVAELDLKGAVSSKDTKVLSGIVWMKAGSFLDWDTTKEYISSADVAVIKALVGNSNDSLKTTIFDINEYWGVDAGDYSQVLSSVNKNKTIVGTVDLGASSPTVPAN